MRCFNATAVALDTEPIPFVGLLLMMNRTAVRIPDRDPKTGSDDPAPSLGSGRRLCGGESSTLSDAYVVRIASAGASDTARQAG